MSEFQTNVEFDFESQFDDIHRIGQKIYVLYIYVLCKHLNAK